MDTLSKAFTKLKRNRKADFERLRRILGFDLGTQKRTRLTRSLQRACTTLLDAKVSASYAGKLESAMHRHWRPERRTKDEEQDQLRFLTVLDSAVPLDVGEVVHAGRKLARRIQAALEAQGVWCIGVVEIEIISLARLRRAATSSAQAARSSVSQGMRNRQSSVLDTLQVEPDSLRENARRKHTVIESLIPPLYRFDDGPFALVHFHGLVDLGKCAGRNGKHDFVVKQLKKLWDGNFRVDLKTTFYDQAIGDKLKKIAEYMTKGGNEDLRYKDTFGREQVEGKIWLLGTGRADSGGETFEDEHALTVGEICDLDAIYRELMGQNGMGFVVRVPQQKQRKTAQKKPRSRK